MNSMLKLPSRDRSTFFFRRTGLTGANSNDDAAEALKGLGLPAITHVDTSSLIGLFDKYQNLEVLDEARNFAWPVNSGPREPKIMDGTQVGVVRYDSTGSSSMALSQKSNASPPMTRQSSSSSIELAVSPMLVGEAKPKDETIKAPIVAERLQGPSNDDTILLKKPNRASTWDPLTSRKMRDMDLDKPLPAGPPNGLRPARSSEQEPAELEGLVRYRSLNQHKRSVSASVPTTPVTVARKPIRSSPRGNSRGERLGKAIVNTNSRRTKSETLVHGVHFASDTKNPGVPTTKPKTAKSPRSMCSRTAEYVIYRIMCNLDSVQDLQSAAMVSKGFLNTYLRNESKLVSHLVFKSSRPAWELRRTMLALRGSRCFRLKEYQQDLRTIDALKALIANQCSNNCKAKTLTGLTGQDLQCQTEVDNALWRVWTFCALFGSNAAQSSVSTAELDWLNGNRGAKGKQLGPGFAIGNGDGLTVDELEDMSEIWQCLHTLLSRFYARDEEAKQAGVFDNWHHSSSSSSHQHVAEWVAHLLTLGPQVVLSLASGSFEKAQMLGLTQWNSPGLGQSRLRFVTAAISQVYQERILTEATTKAAQIALPPGPKHRPSKSVDESVTRQASKGFRSLRVDTGVVNRRPISTTVPKTAPVEIRPDCDPVQSLPIQNSALFPATPTNDPSFFHTLSMSAAVSTKLGATLFPIDYSNSTPRVPFRKEERAVTAQSEVIDPTDKAMHLLTKELGFPETNARRALAMTDTGSGIDVQKAVNLLAIESSTVSSGNTPIELPTPADIVSPLRNPTKRRDYCDKSCKRGPSTRMSINSSVASRTNSVLRHTRSKSASNVGSRPPLSPITDIYGGHSDSDRENDTTSIEWRREEARGDTISPLVPRPLRTSGWSNSLGSTRHSKAWKVLGTPESPLHPVEKKGLVALARARSKSSGVVGMEEYARRVERRRSIRAIQEEKREQMDLHKQREERNKKEKKEQDAATRGTMSEGISQQLRGLSLGGLRTMDVTGKRKNSKGKGGGGDLGGCLPVGSPF